VGLAVTACVLAAIIIPVAVTQTSRNSKPVIHDTAHMRRPDLQPSDALGPAQRLPPGPLPTPLPSPRSTPRSPELLIPSPPPAVPSPPFPTPPSLPPPAASYDAVLLNNGTNIANVSVAEFAALGGTGEQSIDYAIPASSTNDVKHVSGDAAGMQRPM
jgi:hypothetical protein